MPYIYANLDDINLHLPDDKADMDDATASGVIQVDITRFVRALLVNTFPATTIAGWDSPTNTPEIIRAIAGRLIASKHYSTIYSEDTDGIPDLAQQLYNEATMMINDVRAGRLTVIDASGNEVMPSEDLRFSSDDFWPNDSTGAPKFTMGQTFA